MKSANNQCSPTRAEANEHLQMRSNMVNDVRVRDSQLAYSERPLFNRCCERLDSTVYRNGAIAVAHARDSASAAGDRCVQQRAAVDDTSSMNYRLGVAPEPNGAATLTHFHLADDASEFDIMMNILPPPSEFLDDQRSTIYCNGSQLNSDFELSAVPPSPDYTLWQPRFAYNQHNAEEPRCTCGLDQLIDSRDLHVDYRLEQHLSSSGASGSAESHGAADGSSRLPSAVCVVPHGVSPSYQSSSASQPDVAGASRPDAVIDRVCTAPPPRPFSDRSTAPATPACRPTATNAPCNSDVLPPAQDDSGHRSAPSSWAKRLSIAPAVARSPKRLSIAPAVARSPKLSNLLVRAGIGERPEVAAPLTAEPVQSGTLQNAHTRSVSTPAQNTNSLLAINEDILECRRLLIEQGVLRLWNRNATLVNTDAAASQLDDDLNAPAQSTLNAPAGSGSLTSSSGSNSDAQTFATSSNAQSPACLRSTLKLLGRGKTETALVLEGDAVTMNVLRSAYWSFSRVQLKRSITHLGDMKREADSLQMFDGILSFSGIKTKVSRQVNIVDRYEVVQLLIKKCLESSELCDEFYLQLIKQTNDNPEPGGPISLANWHLLTIACGIVPPANQLIVRYLTAHLRKMAIVRQYIDESRLAQRCLRLHASLSDKPRRKCPPSCKEIMSVTNKKPVHEKVFLLDGRIVLVETHPHVTALQVCSHVKSSIGMRQSSKHFALYELHHTYERAMQTDTYLCDSLFVWEQYAKKHRTVREVRYMMKKKLFIEPFMSANDQVEVELVYSQLINEVFESRIPMAMESVVALCALIAQAEVGDYNSECINLHTIEKTPEKASETTGESGKNLFDYRSTTRILPRDLRERVRLSEIAEKHQKYSGMKVIETRVESIALIKSWSLSGAGLFRVTQENSILTRSFILAVNSAGIHFLSGSVSQGNLSLAAPFASYPFSHIVCLSPELESLTLTVRGQTRELEKNVFRTAQAYQIVDLITDYMNELRFAHNNHSEPTRRRKNRNAALTTHSRREKTPDVGRATTQSAVDLNGNGNVRLSRKNRVQSGSTSTSSNSEVVSQTHSTPT